jgi:uroporphyrinogen-III synthase
VLQHLMDSYDLDGVRIAVQLHGEPLPDLVQTLRLAGAEVIEVPVYRWVVPEDPTPLRRLVDNVAASGVDAVSFTSAPAAASFLRAADEQGLGDRVRQALRGPVLAACVGPVTAGPLLREDIPVIQPSRMRLGALVREIVEQLPARRRRVLPVAGHVLDVRGHAVVVDGTLVPLSAASMALLVRLAARPGQVVPRRELLNLTPGEAGDEHSVEVAVGRLRAALGDPRIVLTVVKRGYRLAYEPERAGTYDGGWRY